MTDPLAAAYEATWARFRSLTTLSAELNTVDSAWARGRSDYLAFLIPVDDPAAIGYIQPLADEVARIPGVEPYPAPYWHITIKGAGFLADPASHSDEVSPESLESIQRIAAEVFAAQPSFDITLGLINGFAEVVIIEVWNSLPVRNLNSRLLEAVPGIYRQPFDGALFLPHISIARYTSDEGLPQLKETLARLRTQPPGPALTITSADLIRAELTPAIPILHPLHSFQLGTRH
jgi:2'-5' RNA ligase superfamily protein